MDRTPGKPPSAGALQVSLGGNLDNRTGTIESNGTQLTLSAGTVDNTSDRIAQAGGITGGSLAGAGYRVQRGLEQLPQAPPGPDMLDKLRKAKTNGARDALFREYAQLSLKQSAEIANCRGAACDQIVKDIEEGKQALKANGVEIDKLAGIANQYGASTRERQYKDGDFVDTQIAFNALAKDRAKTFAAMKIPDATGEPARIAGSPMRLIFQ